MALFEAMLIVGILTPTLAGAVESPDVRRILRQASRVSETLPEGWSTKVTMADFRMLQETGDKYRAKQDIAIAQAEAGDLQDALMTIAGFQSPLVPAGYTDNYLLPTLIPLALAQSRAGDREAAVATLRRALRVIEAAQRPDQLSLMKDVAVAQARVGDRAAATATARTILEATDGAPLPMPSNNAGGPDIIDRVEVLRLAARALEAAGERQAAEDARRRERKIIEAVKDVGTKASLLWDVVIERKTAGDMPGALQAARDILDLGAAAKKPPEDLSLVILPLAIEFIAIDQAETDWAAAMRTLDRFGGQPAWHQTLRVIASAPGRSGNWAAALARQKRLLLSVEAAWSTDEKIWFLPDIASSEAELGDRPAALATARRVRTLFDAARWPATYSDRILLVAIARIQAKAGDRRAAFETLSRVWVVVETIKDDAKRFSEVAEVAGAHAELGDGDGAMRLHAKIPGQYVAAKNHAAKAIALARGKAGELSGARRALDALIEDRNDPRAALVIAEEVAEQVALERAKAGDVPWALEWAEGQKIPLAKVRALIGTAHGLMQRPGAEGRKPAAP